MYYVIWNDENGESHAEGFDTYEDARDFVKTNKLKGSADIEHLD